jgi:hypothetical protein
MCLVKGWYSGLLFSPVNCPPQVGRNGASMCYSYSCSRGAFAGVSIDGSLLTTRNDVNLDFYGVRSLWGALSV